MLATSLEAVFAALYLGGGLAAVFPVVRRLMRLEATPACEPERTRSPARPGSPGSPC